jgi:CHASE2 domain-containing sensor protein
MARDPKAGRFETPPEQPRSEPEIIPPNHGGAGRGDGYVWVSTGQGGTQRIYMARPGPFSVIVALLIAGLVLAALVLLLLGFALFFIPVIVFIIAAVLLAGYTRHYWARLKLWAKTRRMG